MKTFPGKQKRFSNTSSKRSTLTSSSVTTIHSSSRIVLPIQTSTVTIIQDDLGSIQLSAHVFRIKTAEEISIHNVRHGRPAESVTSSADEQQHVSFSVSQTSGPKICTSETPLRPILRRKLYPQQTLRISPMWPLGILDPAAFQTVFDEPMNWEIQH